MELLQWLLPNADVLHLESYEITSSELGARQHSQVKSRLARDQRVLCHLMKSQVDLAKRNAHVT
jgi:hypothetical protein